MWELILLIDLFWLFLIYSFLGFLLETSFAKATRAKKQNRKCRIFFPICPVYGFGALILTSLPSLIQQDIFLLFCFGFITASTIEYLTGILYGHLFHVSFWDYRGMPYHVQGQICLPFSVGWGMLGVILICGLHPAITPLVLKIPRNWFLPAFYGFLADTTLTFCILKKTKDPNTLKWYSFIREQITNPYSHHISAK